MMHSPFPMIVHRRWLVLAILCTSLLLVSVDATVLHMALPALSADLHPTATEQLWIIAAYSLVAAPLLLVFGTLGDRYGRRRVLVLGYLIFGLASIACASAPDVPLMIAARAVLGVGGAMIMPATLSLLRQAFPDRRERRMAIGIWSGVAGSGAVFGPLLGGVLVETSSWHAAFLINVPVMVAAVPLTYWLVPESADPPDGPWDLLSAVLSALGVAGVAFAINQTPHGGWMYVVGPVAGLVGCALLVAFVLRQRKSANPLLEIALFANPAFSVAVGTVLLVMTALVGLGLLFAQYLQVVLALEPIAAAMRLLFVMGSAVIGSVIAGPLVQRFGNRLMTVAGVGMCGLASLAAAQGLTAKEDLWLLGPVLTAIGFGVSVSLTAASDALLAAAPPEQAGAAAAIEETAYELGAGIGVASMGTVATAVYAATLPAVPGVPASAVSHARAGLTEAQALSAELPPEAGEQLLELARTAFVHGLRVALAASAVLFALTAVTAARALSKPKESSP